jgi:DNA-3-methyladenine glycosylase II
MDEPARAACSSSSPPVYRDEAAFRQALVGLARRDTRLHAVLRTHGVPPFWRRGPGFASLAQIILEQQVSLAAATAVHDRVRRQAGGGLDAATVMRLGAEALGRCGVTRPKQRTLLALAAACESGRLDLDALAAHDDDAAVRALTDVHGIGPWTAHVYLLIVLCRADAWPADDVALLRAMQTALDLAERPSPRRGAALAEPWRPHRGAAARLLYHLRLCETGRQFAA